ncbi:hypothetical protein KUTeg_014652, partial [Tegillarca granosa]
MKAGKDFYLNLNRKISIDKELASGEYFLKSSHKKARIEAEEKKLKEEKRKEKRSQSFVPPKESSVVPKKKLKTSDDSKVNVEELKKKIKKAQ